MTQLKPEIQKIFAAKKIGAYQINEGYNRELYIPVSEDDFARVIEAMSENYFNLISVFAAENFLSKKGFTLFYAFEKKGFAEFAIIVRDLKGAHTTSIAEIFPAACWFEREVRDGFGIEFDNAFDKRRLFMHEIYPDDFHPLLKSFKNQKIKTKTSVKPSDEYKFKEVKGEGVYQIPVGPVHAGIIEPGHFRFSVIGETIFNLEIRMFFKHRGIEKLAEGKAPHECVAIAETISGDESVANACAFSQAVEKISSIEVPVRALQIRTVFLEMERIYSLLSDMAGMIIDIAYPVGATPFFILREEIFRQNEALTGSRFMKGIISVGGLKKDVPDEKLKGLVSYLDSFGERFDEASKVSHSSSFSVIDRLETTGVIRKELIRALNLTGPMARAAGTQNDTRFDHPYGMYDKINVSRGTFDKGDVLSRFDQKANEIRDSLRIIRKIVTGMQRGEVAKAAKIKDGYALSVVEAPRGQSMHWVYVRNGVVDRYKVRTASFCNWQAIEHAVIGNIVPDFPLVNKSLNLSYAGTDL